MNVKWSKKMFFLLRFDSEIKNMGDVYYRLLLFGANLPKCESDNKLNCDLSKQGLGETPIWTLNEYPSH